MSWLSGFLQGGSTTQTKDPWKPAVSGLKTSLDTASNLYANRPAMYGGNFVAPNDPTQSEGLGWTEALARSLQGQNFGQSTLNLANQFQNNAANYKVPTFADYNTDAIKPVIAALTDPALMRYQTEVAPQTMAAQDRSGATHNVRAGLENYSNADAFARETGNLAATTAYQDFSDWRNLGNQNNQFQTSMLPQLMTSAIAQLMMPGSLLQQTGAGRQSLGQNDINNALAKDQYNRSTPWQDFMNLFNVQSTAGQLGGTTTTQANANPLTQIMKLLGPIAGNIFSGGSSDLSTALSGSSGDAGSGFMNVGKTAGNTAGASSAAVDASNAGSIMSAIAMSTREAKENIEELSGWEALDKLISMPAYKYNYIGDSTPRFGPMAEDWAPGAKVIPMPQYLGLLHAALREIALRMKNG